MKTHFQKSGKKALANIHLQIPKSYVVLGILSMALWQGCGKDESLKPEPPKPAENKAPVISQISKESKLTFSQEEFSKENLLKAIKQYLLDNKKIDDENPRGVHVELLTDISLVKEGKVEVQFVVVDEKGQKSRPATLTVEILKSVEVISLSAEVEQLFPAKLEIQSVIDLSKVQAVDSKNTLIKPTKITVNGQEVQAGEYTLDQAGNIEFIFTFPEGYTPQTLTKVVQVNYKEAQYAEFDTSRLYDALGFSDWPEKAINNNSKYGYFDAIFALKYMNPSLHTQIEQDLRSNAVGRRDIKGNMYYQDPRVEDSGNDGKNNNHSNAQIATYFGDKGTSLLSQYAMQPKNGNYTVYAINHGDDGVDEMIERNLREMVAAAPGDARVGSDWTDEDWNMLLGNRKKLSAKLAQGDFSLKIIFAPHNELVTYDEARKPEGVGKMVSEIVAFLKNNPQSAKHSMIFTFVRSDSGGTPNGTMSEQFYKTFSDNGGVIIFAPSEMGRVYWGNSDNTSSFIPDIATLNSNSLSGVGAIADYTVMSTVLKNLTAQGQVDFSAFCSWYQDTEGYAQGWKLDYTKFVEQVYGISQLPSIISVSGKDTFQFSEYLPQRLLAVYGDRLRINTPWGMVKSTDDVSVAMMKGYDLSDATFSLGIVQDNGKMRKISDWNPVVQGL